MNDNPRTQAQFIKTLNKHGLEYFGKYYGKYRGTIVNTDDPEGRGRVQLRVPQIAGDNVIEIWADPTHMGAGDDFGDFFTPPVGSNTWVEFEGGDPNIPLWGGGSWGNKAQRAPSATSGIGAKNRARVTEKWQLEMDDENDVLRISSKAGGHKIEVHGNGNITVSGGGDFSKETGGDASDEIGGNASLNVGGNLGVSCVNFSLNASGTATCEIGGVTIAFGGGSLEMTSGGSNLRIDGSGVNIMNKDFLTHTHSGVDTGGGTSGGVA